MAFRQSFLVSYAVRIGERLAEAAGQAEREAVAEQAGTTYLLEPGRPEPGRAAARTWFRSSRPATGRSMTRSTRCSAAR